MTKYSIGACDVGKRVLAFLKESLDLPNKAIKKVIDHGGVRLNGVVERFSTTVLQKGDQLEFDPSKMTREIVFSLPILYEEKAFLLCHKPSGLVTNTESFQKLLKIPVILVHRLDKETSGVMVLAKTQKMQGQLEALFKKREITKIYVALVKGRVRKESGTIENRLKKKTTYQGQSIWGSTRSSKGLRAVTHWKCLKKGKGVSLIECQLETGRTHQLRVHLSEMGHPILGDYQYGRKIIFPSGIHRLCLHAYRLAFLHPETGKKVQATAPLPKLFNLSYGFLL